MLALYMSFIDDESQRRLFEEIYLNYRKQMLLVARSVLGSDTDAEEEHSHNKYDTNKYDCT